MEFLSMKNTLRTPTPIGQSMGALMAERATLRLENHRLQDPALPDYIALWSANRKRLGITTEQTLDIALLHLGFDKTVDAPMPPDMREAFVEYAEGRAEACVIDNPQAPTESLGNVIAFRKRNTQS
jgi:hypothetical protein